MIDNGRIVFADTMDAFNNYMEPHSVVMHMDNPPAAEELLQLPGITKADYLTEKQIRLYFNGDQEITERIVDVSVAKGWRLREIMLDKSSLDEIFAQLSNHNGRTK
jgi:ABC-2 type transport system ATP-binding protein